MDLPAYLECEEFVNGQKELEQTISLLLKNEVGTIVQNFEMGSIISPHNSTYIDIDYGITQALSVLENFQIISIKMDNFPTIDLIYQYNGAVSNFSFIVDTKDEN